MILQNELYQIKEGRAYSATENYSILAIKDNFVVPDKNIDHYDFCNISAEYLVKEIKKHNK